MEEEKDEEEVTGREVKRMLFIVAGVALIVLAGIAVLVFEMPGMAGLFVVLAIVAMLLAPVMDE